MGIRATQIFGLNDDAEGFIATNAKRGIQPCPCCGQETSNVILKREYGSAREQGMFDDGPPLYEYELSDGRVAREIVQAVVWSSGPCIFLCLEIDGKREFEWFESEIQAA